jgi:hypothetical protein
MGLLVLVCTTVVMVEESLAKRLAGDMAAFRAARRVKQALAEELKDDQNLLDKANASVDLWLEEQ